MPNPIRNRIHILLSAFLIISTDAYSQPSEKYNNYTASREILLWPGEAPGSENVKISETVTHRSNDPAVSDRIIQGITTPSLQVFIPEKINGTAVLICPGGGYGYLSYDKEGVDIARWLNASRITAFILKYRLPCEGHENSSDVPLQDAQRAIRTIRSGASDWNIDPDKIGVMGFSAGGHLASMLGTCFNRNVYSPQDADDNISARPDFMILLYPVISMDSAITHSGSQNNLLGLSPGAEIITYYSSDLQVNSSTPSTFIALASDDASVIPENSLRFYRALLEAGVPIELHIFQQGGHGFCIRNAKGSVSQWTFLCVKWMSQNGF